MFLTINHKNFDPHNIIISEKTKNNVMIGSDFIDLYLVTNIGLHQEYL